jgi:hypothetical protein
VIGLSAVATLPHLCDEIFELSHWILGYGNSVVFRGGGRIDFSQSAP